MTPSASPNAAGASSRRTVAITYDFKTIDDDADLAFNELLGINDSRMIAGYYGSGILPSHPNKGYTVTPPYKQSDFTSENYPGSLETQVTCIDKDGNIGGFWVDKRSVTRGFIEWNGVFTSYAPPKAVMTQILGLNDTGTAVGFYTDRKGVNHGFELDQSTGKFRPIVPPNATNVTASAINNNGDIVGFYTAGSQTVSFWDGGPHGPCSGCFRTYLGFQTMMAFGVNDDGSIVGTYVLSGASYGFLIETKDGNEINITTGIEDPEGVGTTTIHGINDRGDMVGFYVDSSGNTNGMLFERKK